MTVTQPRSPFGVVELGRGDSVTGFSEGGAIPYWVSCGIYVLSRRGARSVPRPRRPRVDDLPRARLGGSPLRLPPRRPLADREHAQGAAHGRRPCRGAPGVDDMTGPDVGSLAPWAFETRRVDKPWGYELIWAVTDIYVGKVLFVKAGESLSLQYHEQKDESWLIQSGRAQDRARRGRRREARRGGRRPRRGVPLPPRHRPPHHRGRGHDDPRGLDAASRRRRAPRRQLRPRRHLGAVARPAAVTKPSRTRHTFLATRSGRGDSPPLPGVRGSGAAALRWTDPTFTQM